MNRDYLNYQADKTGSLYMTHCGFEQKQRGELCGPNIRTAYLLHYVLKGKGCYRAHDRTCFLSQGDVFVIFPGDVISYQADEQEPWAYCWIAFQGTAAEEYCQRIGVSRDRCILHPEDDRFPAAVSSCLDYTELNRGNLSQLRLSAFVLEILSSLEPRHPLPDKGAQKQNYINKALHYIESNCHRKILPSDVSAYVGLEYSYFYKLFKGETGVSPEHYLIRLRIEKAKVFIQAGFSFQQIPELIGVSDVFYFFKLFKKVTGMTPSAYRKSLEGNREQAE